MPLDEIMFWKVFRLVGSPFEEEALVALRKLRAMLKTEEMGWNDFCATLEDGYRHGRILKKLQEEAAKRRTDIPQAEWNNAIKKVFGL